MEEFVTTTTTDNAPKEEPWVDQIFTVDKGRLKATKDMYWEFIEDFDKAIAKLLDSRRSRVEVDLTQVTFISSSYLGGLSNMVVMAARKKKRIILKVNQDVSWLFDIMGGQKNVCMEIY